MTDTSLFCPNCGIAVAEKETSDNMKDDLGIRNPRGKIFVFLTVLVLVVALPMAHMIAYSGYKTFLGSYLESVGSGDREAVLSCHSWEDVQERMEDRKNNWFDLALEWEDLEDYVRSNDDLYDARIMGNEILSWEIRDSGRNYFTLSNPEMWVEVYMQLDGTSDDVIAVINMKKDDDGWFVTRVDAVWASLAEDD